MDWEFGVNFVFCCWVIVKFLVIYFLECLVFLVIRYVWVNMILVLVWGIDEC